MRIIRLALFLILTNGISAKAQTITIISAHTNEPLPFATIQNLRAQWAMVCSEKGTFTFTDFNSKSGDSVLITYTGYKPIRMEKPLEDRTIEMEPLAATLQSVDVLPCPGNKISSLANFKKNKSDWSFACNEEGLESYAAYLPNNSKTKAIISSIHIYLRIDIVPKIAAGAPLKIRILNYDEILQKPGNPLLLKELVVYPAGKEIVVDISEEWIRLPANGLVVAIDFFFADKKYIYSSKSTYKNEMGKRIVSINYYYGPNIKFLRGDNLIGKGFYYDYIKNEWKEMKYTMDENNAPKINLTLKLCE